jgi:hypothetical protein
MIIRSANGSQSLLCSEKLTPLQIRAQLSVDTLADSDVKNIRLQCLEAGTQTWTSGKLSSTD